MPSTLVTSRGGAPGAAGAALVAGGEPGAAATGAAGAGVAGAALAGGAAAQPGEPPTRPPRMIPTLRTRAIATGNFTAALSHSDSGAAKLAFLHRATHR